MSNPSASPEVKSSETPQREADCPAPFCSPCFVVLAFRYGGNEDVFPIGVFSNHYEAEVAAREHRNYRGGKYFHRIYQFRSIGKWDDDVGHSANSKPCIEANAQSEAPKK